MPTDDSGESQLLVEATRDEGKCKCTCTRTRLGRT